MVVKKKKKVKESFAEVQNSQDWFDYFSIMPQFIQISLINWGKKRSF